MTSAILFLRSVLNNRLGDRADTLVAAAREMPQLITLCGIQPEQEDIDFSQRMLNAGDAKLLAFDLSKHPTIRILKCALAPANVSALTEKQTPFCSQALWLQPRS